MKSLNLDEYPKEYIDYIKSVYKKNKEFKKNLIENCGFISVCIEPNYMTFNEWEKSQKKGD
jgi:predicted methyltransferase